MTKRTTIADIALAAGVSTATVSNVINGAHSKVSQETTDRVLHLMKKMDYQPNLVARSLSKRRSEMLGLFLPIIDGNSGASLLLRDNPFYGELVSGVESQAANAGYDILMKGVRPDESCRDWVRKRDLDGAIFVGNYTNLISEEMQDLGRKLVLVDCYDEGVQNHSTIGIDDENGGYMATAYLLRNHHRRIALAGSNISVDGPIYRRYLGYKRAMEAHGCTDVSDLIFQEPLSFDGGYRVGCQLLSRPDITAVFAVGDVMAFGILKAMNEAGRVIPQDLSIVGFDNVPACEYSMPALTSVSQQIYDRGRLAVDALLEAIRENNPQITHTILPVSLKERNSVAPLVVRKDL